MGLKAKSDLPEIEFSKSTMVGDSISDMEFGKNLGMKTVFIGSKSEINNMVDLLHYGSLLEFYKNQIKI